MRKYKILDLKNNDEQPDKMEVIVCHGGRFFFPIGPSTKSLKKGGTFRVIGDRYCHSLDKVYLWRGGMYMCDYNPAPYESPCKRFISDIGGISDGTLDRLRFKTALIKECRRRGKTPSLIAWRNLQKVCQDNQNPGR
jgi:hypothetical protein